MSADGDWKITLNTPMGPQEFKLSVTTAGESFTGRLAGPMGDDPVEGKVAGETLTWSTNITKPMPMTLEFTAKVDGDSLSGNAKLGAFGDAALSGVRA